MEDSTAWCSAGRLGEILDHLIAEGLARPMVVVMPLGYGFPNYANNMSIQFGGSNDQRSAMDGFERSLLDEIAPRVEADYRLVRSNRSRALAGLSLGGAQALSIGLRHPEVFGYVGSFSGAFVVYGSNPASWLPKSIDPATRLVEIDCGEQDFLIGVNRKIDAMLEKWPHSGSGPPISTAWTPGAHTWPVWRRDLIRFVPKLFEFSRSRSKG
jgi:enterochelin esterase family protein